MGKQLLFMRAALCGILFLFGLGNVQAQVLTIGDTSTLTVNGGVLDVNCLDILVKSGGTLDLQSGTLLDKKAVIVDAGGTYDNTFGTVLNCDGNSFYVIPSPNGKATIISLPRN